MKIGVELEFFICHKSDETFYMPRYYIQIFEI